MTNRSIVVDLPEDVYERVKRQAEQAHRTVEDEVADLVDRSLPKQDDGTHDMTELLDQLDAVPDDALWRAARGRMSKKSLARLESLHHKRQREGLTDAEAQEAAALTNQYERTVLIRAHAAALLKERGHDVSVLLSKP